MKITQHTPYLWSLQNELYATNSGIFCNAGEALLIDPGIDPTALKKIAGFLKTKSCKPKAIVLTHAHWDHILGPQHFPGVPVIAQINYNKEITQQNSRIQKQIERWEKKNGIKRVGNFAPPPAQTLFSEELLITVGKERLRLIHAPGHAADQCVVYHAKSRTLWAADMLSDLEIPQISHNLAAYKSTLEKLSTLEIDVLIPGHGTPSDEAAEIKSRFENDRAYLATLRTSVTAAMAEQQTAKEVVAACSEMPYNPGADNQHSHKLNVESVYLELGGSGDPEKLGWTAQ